MSDRSKPPRKRHAVSFIINAGVLLMVFILGAFAGLAFLGWTGLGWEEKAKVTDWITALAAVFSSLIGLGTICFVFLSFRLTSQTLQESQAANRRQDERHKETLLSRDDEMRPWVLLARKPELGEVQMQEPEAASEPMICLVLKNFGATPAINVTGTLTRIVLSGQGTALESSLRTPEPILALPPQDEKEFNLRVPMSLETSGDAILELRVSYADPKGKVLGALHYHFSLAQMPGKTPTGFWLHDECKHVA